MKTAEFLIRVNNMSYINDLNYSDMEKRVYRLSFSLKIIVLLFIVFPFAIVHLIADNKVAPMENGIFRDNIRTVQFFRQGWEFSLPVIELGTDQRIVLKFDELSDGVTNFSYTITHCDADWYQSRIGLAEYMEGFAENPVNDFASSANTTVKFTNYQLTLPNDQVRILVSGNYLLSVFDEGDRNTPVITRRFYVLEPTTDIKGEVKKSTFEGYKGRDQEVDFTVDYSKISIQDPRTELKVVLMQNTRTDNCLVDLKPSFVKDNQVGYGFDHEYIFPGGNEFRNFDAKNLQTNGSGVANTEYKDALYQVNLRTDHVRRSADYLTESDLNGRYLIKNDNTTDADLESDYILVHFSLEMVEPLGGGHVYVFGSLSNWLCLPANKMTWNYELKRYEAALTLKQGFYDYQYVYIQNGDNKVDDTMLEGSHVETENDYQVFVYQRGFSSRYDKLIGYKNINSVKR